MCGTKDEGRVWGMGGPYVFRGWLDGLVLLLGGGLVVSLGVRLVILLDSVWPFGLWTKGALG